MLSHLERFEGCDSPARPPAGNVRLRSPARNALGCVEKELKDHKLGV